MPDFPQIARQQEYYLSLLPEVRRRYGHLPGVDVIGLGDKERRGQSTDEWAWRFYVRKKYPLSEINEHEQIPAEIFGVQTDVIVHHEHRDLVCDATTLPANTLINDEEEYRNLGGIFGGAPIRNEYFKSDTNSGYGTLGMLVRRVSDKRLMGLTCAHVVNAAGEMNATGTNVGQPRYWVSCCCCPKGSIGPVRAATHYSISGAPKMDCALIEIDDDIRKKAKANVADDAGSEFPLADTLENKVLGHSLLVGTSEADKTTYVQTHAITVTGARSVMCFDNVIKRGRGTGLTTGKIVEVAFGTDQMMIRRTGTDENTAPFACHGDSGAMIISASDRKVLGMVVAGVMETYEDAGVQKKRLTRTIATHIKPIMQHLGIKIAGTQFGTMGEPVGGGVNGCEIKIWPGGHTNPALNPPETFDSTHFYAAGGNINWEVLAGPGGALIVERDGVPINPGVTTVSNAAQIKVRYGTVSASSGTADAIQVKGTRGSERPSTVFRTVFKITPRPINVSGALDAANQKRFIGPATSTAGLEYPATGGITRYLAKAEIIYDVLPADVDWNGGIIAFITGSGAGALGNIRPFRETKFCRGGQAVGEANRTHNDQADWIAAGDSSNDDFQPPSSASRDKIFRLANKGFNPVIESQDINHDTYNPDNYLQRYVRAHYRDRMEFFNGTAWVPLTADTEWSVNFTGGLSVVVPHVAPPVPGAAAANILVAGLNADPLPNTQPTITISTANPMEVRPGQTNIILTAVPVDADLDVLTDVPNAPPPPPPARPAVQWTQSPAAPAIALTPNPADPRNSVRFTAPGVDAPFTFTAITNDNTAGLSRAPVVPPLPTVPNFQSPPATTVVNVVEWRNIGGGDPNTARNMTEVFTAAAFHLGAASLDFDVHTGGIAAVIIERNGVAIAPTTSVANANSIRVRYDTRSNDLTRAQTVRIRATNTGTGATWFRRRTVFHITVAVHATDGAPPHTHLIPSTLGAVGQDHFCTAQGQGNSVFQATIQPAPNPPDISWNGGAFAFTCPSVGADRTTAHISSNTGTGQDIPYSVRIGGDICYNGRYWTIWTSAPTVTLGAPPYFAVGPTGIGFQGPISFLYNIQPASIISATPATVDIPDLRGANTSLGGVVINPPRVPAADVSVQNSGAGVLNGGADHKWDVSRQNKQKPIGLALVPNSIAHATAQGAGDLMVLYTNYPSDPLAGNDDRGTADEDNDPYVGNANAAVGQLLSTDTPGRFILHSDGAVGNTFELRLHFREFVRVLLDDRWYPISGFSEWRFHMRTTKSSEAADGVDYDNDGAMNREVWRNDGTLLQQNNTGF